MASAFAVPCLLSGVDCYRRRNRAAAQCEQRHGSSGWIHSDLCIVGSGPAAVSLALSVGKQQPQRRIVLLESEPLDGDFNAQQLNCSKAVGDLPAEYCETTRTRAWGGSSLCWHGVLWQIPRSQFFKDMDDAPGWPIEYTDLEGFYGAAWRFFDVELRPSNDCVLHYFNVHQGLQLPVGRRTLEELGHLATVAALPNVTILRGATVAKLMADGGHVVEARAIVAGPEGRPADELRVSARHFVLAAGGIENARLLLLSDLGGKSVGTFRTHINLPVAQFRLKWQNVPDIQLRSIFRRMLADVFEAEDAGNPEPPAVMYVTGPKAEVASVQSNAGCALLLSEPPPFSPRSRSNTSQERTALAILETHGAAQSRVTLSQDLDELGIQQAVLNWQLQDSDVARLLELSELLHRELDEAGLLEDFSCTSGLGKSDILNKMRLAAHHIGTTPMAATAEDGAVDCNCCVFGTDNLFVCGSSIFPSGSFAAPTLTVVALALRLASHLCSLEFRNGD